MKKNIFAFVMMTIVFIGCGSDNGISGLALDETDDAEEVIDTPVVVDAEEDTEDIEDTEEDADTDTDAVSCQICTFSTGAVELDTEYCDNGDGTVTLTTNGVEQTTVIPGTFASFIALLETSGQVCN